MSLPRNDYHDEHDRQKSLIIAIVIHILLLLIAFLPLIRHIDTPTELSGISIAFGQPDAGAQSIAPSAPENDNAEAVTPSTPPPPADAPTENSTASKVEIVDTEPTPAENTPETLKPVVDNSEISAAEEAKRKAEAQEAAKKAEAKRQAMIAEQKAREEARKKAEAEAAKQKQFAESKSKFSDLLGKGAGDGGTAGNQGDPSGDPNSDALDGIAQGSGRIGDGLTDRDVVYQPDIDDASQRVGKVVVKVCVQSDGTVSEANYTQRGSTTTDSYLIQLAEKAAKKYRFSASDIPSQCGNIIIDFKVR